MTLVFLDVETTGLDPNRHEVWEIAYAVDEGPIECGVVMHSLRYADPKALAMNGYWGRGVVPQSPELADVETACRFALQGATLVAANPAFDAAFLRARWGETPWHYRLLDVEAFAAGILGWATPKGLRDIRNELIGCGYDIPKPDHSAAADVETLRACYKALRLIQGAS